MPTDTVMELAEMISEGRKPNAISDLTNVNNNNKGFATSPAGQGLPNTALHQQGPHPPPASEQQQQQQQTSDCDVNESAGGQQGNVA